MRQRAADLTAKPPRQPRTSQVGGVETVQEGTPTTADPHPFGKPPQVIHDHYKNQSNNVRCPSLITGEQQRRPLQYERGFEQRDGFSVKRPSDNYHSWHDHRPPPIDTSRSPFHGDQQMDATLTQQSSDQASLQPDQAQSGQPLPDQMRSDPYSLISPRDFRNIRNHINNRSSSARGW